MTLWVFKRYEKERGSEGEDFWSCGWITEERTSCWKNGTPFARITKREPAGSRDETGTEWKRTGERESLRDLAHSKWLKDWGNWILAFDRASGSSNWTTRLSLHLVALSLLSAFSPYLLVCCHFLLNSLSNSSFAPLTFFLSNNSLSSIFNRSN